MNIDKNFFSFSPEVRTAIDKNQPVLALESTIIAHGMPYPQNIDFAHPAEAIARKNGATPATIAIIDGIVHIGLDDEQLKYISKSNEVEKLAVRDLSYAISNKLTGATTVSATMRLAHLAGINVFATGGIGGVHRGVENTFDVSQDLIELSRTPMIVVSAGVKAILDIPKTLEYLETLAITLLGYQTNEFPTFYSKGSGIKIPMSCENPKDIVNIYKTHQKLNLQSALLIANPIPKSDEIPQVTINKYIETALADCTKLQIEGKAVTPFLLKRIVKLTDGNALSANIVLALNNVKLGAQIAHQLSKSD